MHEEAGGHSLASEIMDKDSTLGAASLRSSRTLTSNVLSSAKECILKSQRA